MTVTMESAVFMGKNNVNNTHSTGDEPKQPDKTTSVDGDTTPINDPDQDSISDFLKTTRENTGLFGVPSVQIIVLFAPSIVRALIVVCCCLGLRALVICLSIL